MSIPPMSFPCPKSNRKLGFGTLPSIKQTNKHAFKRKATPALLWVWDRKREALEDLVPVFCRGPDVSLL